MTSFGVLPMAGKGSRLQPIAFSKELYPVTFQQRHFAISEFSIRAMLRANVDEIKLVVSPEKLDIARYYSTYDAPISLYFYDSPSLPESCLFPLFGMRDDDLCLFGLPDTVFAPNDSFVKVRQGLEAGADIVLGLFEVPDGSQYDSVSLDACSNVTGVLVKQSPPLSNWIWGIWGARVSALKKLRGRIDQQEKVATERLLGVGFDSLVKHSDLCIQGIRLGSEFFDVGTMDAVLRIHSVMESFQF